MRYLLPFLTLTVLMGLYVPHVRTAVFVVGDERWIQEPAPTLSWLMLTKGRGLTEASWAVIRTPRASHALNLALHFLVVLLTGLLVWQLTAQTDTAVLVACVLALHPLTIETVAYASNRSELIATVGVLLALNAAVSPWAWTWAAIPLALGLAYLGKETGLIGLLLLPLMLWLRGERVWASRLACGLAGTGVAAVLATWPLLPAVAHLGETVTQAVTPWQWAAIQGLATWRLIVLSIAPFWLSVVPDIKVLSMLSVVGPLVLIAGVLEIAWRCRNHAPLVTAGIVWCAIVAVPRFVVRTPLSPFNEHQWYLAMPGVALLWVAGVSAVSDWIERWSCGSSSVSALA